ncbi:MAG: hypothetical protein Kow0099_27130 [Candidatus Abyssubacteria bacterium]
MNRLVLELLEYSGPVRLHYSKVPLREIVLDALYALRYRLGGIHVELDIENEDAEICVDPEKITRVLMNLMSNAIDAMPEGGRLEIRSRFTESESMRLLNLVVSDTGSGIDEETLQHIQEPFFTTKVKGTGLGLDVCRKVVEVHRGRLSIRSEPGKGTTVELALPVEAQSTETD